MPSPSPGSAGSPPATSPSTAPPCGSAWDQHPSPWLFPGGQPGRPISASHLGQRLKDLGIQPGPARSTALFQLATELPAALLARMLGIHIDVAVAWQHARSEEHTSEL